MSRVRTPLKVNILLILMCFLASCKSTSEKKVEPSTDQNQRNIVKLHSQSTYSSVVQFLHSYKQGLSRGVCEMFFSMDGQANEPCIMTRNGKAYLIQKVNNDKGFRVSKLKLINRNKFINIEDESIWYLEPYR